MKNPFRTLSHEEQLAQSLDQVRRDLLAAEAQAEYLTAMQSMLESRVRRLTLQTPQARGGLR